MLVLEVCLSLLVLVATMAIIKQVWFTSSIKASANLEWPDIYISSSGNRYHLDKCRYVNEKTKKYMICSTCKP